MFHNYILELLTNMLKQTTTVEHNFPISTCWRLSLLYDHLLAKLNDVCLYVEGFGVSTRQASAPSDCLCSLWRPTTFNRHQFRQERQNHHVWVFSYCKYFLSYAFVGCPPCQHWHSKKKGRAQTDLDRGGSFDTVHQGLLKITCQTEGFSVSENTVHLSTWGLYSERNRSL